MAAIINPALAEKIAKGLRKAADEIEELGVQASLGQMEARDVYEKVKKRYKTALHNAVVNFEKAKAFSKDKFGDLRSAIEELRVQLALGKAETRELYDDQSKKIRTAISKLQMQLKKKDIPEKYSGKVNDELKKLKVKLDVLKLKYRAKDKSMRRESKEGDETGNGRGKVSRVARDRFEGRRTNLRLKQVKSRRQRVKEED